MLDKLPKAAQDRLAPQKEWLGKINNTQHNVVLIQNKVEHTEWEAKALLALPAGVEELTLPICFINFLLFLSEVTLSS